MKKRWILLGLLGLFSFLSCEKKLESVEGTVDIYLIDSFEPGEGDIKINDASVRLEEIPVVSYTDIKSYTPDDYTFELSDAAKAAIFEADPTVYGHAFAVVANGEIVYTGYFWPGYFSSSCLWVCIDPLSLIRGNSVQVDLGYPGLPEHVVIPDNRNDERLLSIFRRDGKLKK